MGCMFMIIAAGISLKFWGKDKKFRCPECDAEVSEKARECPKCGAKFQRGGFECPACRGEVSEDDMVCPHCGERFEGAAYICPECGKGVEAKSKKCRHCGAKYWSPVKKATGESGASGIIHLEPKSTEKLDEE